MVRQGFGEGEGGCVVGRPGGESRWARFPGGWGGVGALLTWGAKGSLESTGVVYEGELVVGLWSLLVGGGVGPAFHKSTGR